MAHWPATRKVGNAVAQGGGIRGRARELDNRVLGTSDSKRGWFVNLFMGLNPYLFWVYLAAASVCIVVAAVAVAQGGDWVGPSFSAGWVVFLAYVSRSLPKRWQRTRSR
ncbi:MAG: hypothetical protein JWM02_2447 [Frankiales bacterium]|nr:hypothetical protein [Frankiales bacterium]